MATQPEKNHGTLSPRQQRKAAEDRAADEAMQRLIEQEERPRRKVREGGK